MTTDRHGYQPTSDIGTPPDIDDYQHQTTGQRLKDARTARGWTQWDLVERLGITQTAVSYWELGKRHLTAEALVHVAHALGIEPAELLPPAAPANPQEWADDRPDLCCTHGEQVLARLDRIEALLEGRKAKREPEDDAGNGHPMPADGEVIRAEGHEDLKFSTGGIVAEPGSIVGGGCVDHKPEGGIVVNFDHPGLDKRAVAEATIAELKRQGRLRD